MEIDKEKFESELAQFTGTEHYFKASILSNLKLTDGMQFLREKANCYWLTTIVESVQSLDIIKEKQSFIVWRIELLKGSKFKVTAWDDTPYKSQLLYSQEGPYTDFPIKEFDFYQCGEVLLLQSEY